MNNSINNPPNSFNNPAYVPHPNHPNLGHSNPSNYQRSDNRINPEAILAQSQPVSPVSQLGDHVVIVVKQPTPKGIHHPSVAQSCGIIPPHLNARHNARQISRSTLSHPPVMQNHPGVGPIAKQPPRLLNERDVIIPLQPRQPQGQSNFSPNPYQERRY
jgi:hypothetical protein